MNGIPCALGSGAGTGDDGDAITVPGERLARRQADADAHGIDAPVLVIEALRKLGQA